MEKSVFRTVALWGMITAGFLSHTVCDMMPLFWGGNVAVDQSGVMPQGMVMFMMALTYLVPVVGIVISLYSRCKTWHIVNFILAVIIALFSVFHASELLTLSNYGQLVILPLMIVVAVLLAVESYKMIKQTEK